MEPLVVIPPEDLAHATAAEREKYKLYLLGTAVQMDEWQGLLPALAPGYFSKPFASHHEIFWEWVWEIEADARPRPFVALWPRGQGKSTSVESAVAMLGARGKRRYCLYCSETQSQADDHVDNVATLLESAEFGFAYPQMGEKRVSKFGDAKAWKRSRLRTAAGFTIDAIGLDSAARGIKIEDMRPDLIVLDDIDGELDSPHITSNKTKVITRKLLPAGSRNVAVIGIQNKVHDHSIFARLADPEDADFLRDRIVSGPIPAIYDFEWRENDNRFEIVNGTPSWPEGQGLETCQANMNDWGLSAFLAEAQHATEPPKGGMFDHLDWESIQVSEAELPRMKRIVVWLDPAVTDKDSSDCQGIIVDGLGIDKLYYRLYAWEGRTSPLKAMVRAIKKAIEWNAELVGVETDQGGDTWQSVYREACEALRRERDWQNQPILRGPAPRFEEEKAGAGHGSKAARAQHMLVDYERHKFRHLRGAVTALELGLDRFPKTKPYDVVDCSYYGWRAISGSRRRKGRVRSQAHETVGAVSPR